MVFQDEGYVAAQAGECVFALSDEDERTFFKYSSRLMSNDNNDFDSLIVDARRVGIDVEKMKRCLEGQKFLPEVFHDLERGKEDNVRGTPTVFINGERVSGSQPYEVYAEIIRDMLGDGEDEITHEDIDRRLRSIEDRLDKTNSLLETIIELLKKLFGGNADGGLEDTEELKEIDEVREVEEKSISNSYALRVFNP